jgi:DNA polymerase V
MYYQKPNGVNEKRGFPNAATDNSLQNLDFNQLLIHNGVATFVMRVNGNSWAEQGIFHDDIVLIDKALTAKTNDLVAWVNHDDFSMSYKSKVPLDAVVWGVVTNVIHQLRPKKLKNEDRQV